MAICKAYLRRGSSLYLKEVQRSRWPFIALARREPLRRATAALQLLTRGGGVAIACGLRLAVTRLRGSENVNLYETVH